MKYLAAPYGHPDKKVTQARMEAVYAMAAKLMIEGEHVTTPLFMHEVVTRHSLPGDFQFWREYCHDMLKCCDEMIILCLNGWEESEGVNDEIKFCIIHNIPCRYLEVP